MSQFTNFRETECFETFNISVYTSYHDTWFLDIMNLPGKGQHIIVTAWMVIAIGTADPDELEGE